MRHNFCIRVFFAETYLNECVCRHVFLRKSHESRKPNQNIHVVLVCHRVFRGCDVLYNLQTRGWKKDREWTLGLDMLVVRSSWSSAALPRQGVPLLVNTNTHSWPSDYAEQLVEDARCYLRQNVWVCLLERRRIWQCFINRHESTCYLLISSQWKARERKWGWMSVSLPLSAHNSALFLSSGLYMWWANASLSVCLQYVNNHYSLWGLLNLP